jgi:hypothetical protein
MLHVDWAFLKPRYPDPSDPKSKFELEFIHLDPVLSAHMRTQSLSMLGRGVIEFIHPDEREREWCFFAFTVCNKTQFLLGALCV